MSDSESKKTKDSVPSLKNLRSIWLLGWRRAWVQHNIHMCPWLSLDHLLQEHFFFQTTLLTSPSSIPNNFLISYTLYKSIHWVSKLHFSHCLQTSTCMIFLGSSATIFAICKLLKLSFYSLLTSENSSKVITLFTLFLILTTLVLMFFFPCWVEKNTWTKAT